MKANPKSNCKKKAKCGQKSYDQCRHCMARETGCEYLKILKKQKKK
jgi:hypothetical protein